MSPNTTPSAPTTTAARSVPWPPDGAAVTVWAAESVVIVPPRTIPAILVVPDRRIPHATAPTAVRETSGSPSGTGVRRSGADREHTGTATVPGRSTRGESAH